MDTAQVTTAPWHLASALFPGQQITGICLLHGVYLLVIAMQAVVQSVFDKYVTDASLSAQ